MGITKSGSVLGRSVAVLMLIGFCAALSGCAAQNLNDASKMGQDDQIVKLLAAGQNIEVRDVDNYTPLLWAACSGQLGSAKVLVDHGANIEVTDPYQYTPLMTAVYYKHLEVAAYLISKGAKIDARDKKGWSSLYYAVSNRDENMVKMLLDHGASVKPAAPDQPSPARVAEHYDSGPGIGKLLAEHGAQ